MGMAASQARYIALSARKTNIEYEGQQINQSRLALANQSANLFNQMMGMDVPTPPSIRDFTTVQYSFSDGANSEVLSNYYQLGTADSDYNYVVTTYHNEKVFTGLRKKIRDPQIQYTTNDRWTYDPSSTDNIRSKIVDKAVKNSDGSYTIESSDGSTHIFRQVQSTDDKDLDQVRAINLGLIINGNVEPDVSEKADLGYMKSVTLNVTDPKGKNALGTFGSIEPADIRKIDQLREMLQLSPTQTLNPNDYLYSATANEGKPAFVKKSDWAKTQLASDDPNYSATVNIMGLTDRYNYSPISADDKDTLAALQALYGLTDVQMENIVADLTANPPTNHYYTDGNYRFVAADDYSNTPAGTEISEEIEWDETATPPAYASTYALPTANQDGDITITIGNTSTVYSWTGTAYEDEDGNGFTMPANNDGKITVETPTAAIPGTPNSAAVITQGRGTNGGYFSDGRGNFATLAQLDDAVAAYKHNVETGDHDPISVDFMTPTSKATFSNYTKVGNCRLTELTSADVSDEDTNAEIMQIIKDMKKEDGSQLSVENLMACFDTDPVTGELIYKGGLYTFTMNGQKYYTTVGDLDHSAGTSIVDNDIDAQQNKLIYYQATYLDTKVESTQKALLETDGAGRFATMKLEDDSVVYTLNCEETTDEKAYDDAMNRYYYENAIYEQKLQEINARTEIIHAQDRTLELRMEQLATEQSALQNEMEAVKKVVDKHVEQGFKTFGG